MILFLRLVSHWIFHHQQLNRAAHPSCIPSGLYKTMNIVLYKNEVENWNLWIEHMKYKAI